MKDAPLRTVQPVVVPAQLYLVVQPLVSQGEGHLTHQTISLNNVPQPREVYDLIRSLALDKRRDILVLIPDIARVPVAHHCREFAGPGDEFEVKVLPFNGGRT